MHTCQFLRIFFLWGSIHVNNRVIWYPCIKLSMATNTVPWAMSHKEARHLIHWGRTCTKLQQSDVFWEQTRKVQDAQWQRFKLSSADESEGAGSPWPFHLSNSKTPVQEPQELSRNKWPLFFYEETKLPRGESILLRVHLWETKPLI